MMTVSPLFDIELQPGELVVSAVTYRDYIIVITDRGTVYRITGEER